MTPPAAEHTVDGANEGLRAYLDVIRRRLWLVVGVASAAIAVAVLLSFLSAPTYRAQMKIVIGQGQSLFQVPNGNAIAPFTATMSDLLESNIVAASVIDSLKLDTTPEKLLKKLSVSINPQTAVITAHYDDRKPERAQRILQHIGLVFSQLVHQRFGQEVVATNGAVPQAPITATIFDPAHPLPDRVSPKPVRNVIVAAFLGTILGLLSAFLRDHFDRSIRTREEVERAFGLPVIAQIPFEKGDSDQRRKVSWDGLGETAEAYRALRANLEYLSIRRPVRSILITSATPEQGKTTVAANLGVALARSGASTVVIEADLRRPRLAAALSQPGSGPGLTSLLVGAADLVSGVRDIPLPAGSEGARPPGRCSFIPSGPMPPNPSELLASAPMHDLLARLSATYEYIVIDSPPVLLVADALELARSVDGAIVVVRRDKASTDQAAEFRTTVERLGIDVLGAVFTDVEPMAGYGTYGEDPPSPGRKARRARRNSESLAPSLTPSGSSRDEPFVAEEV